jgi:hypothetical protein
MKKKEITFKENKEKNRKSIGVYIEKVSSYSRECGFLDS